MTTILACDPGLATGFCEFSGVKGQSHAYVVCGECAPNEWVDLLYERLATGAVDAVVCENFFITMRTAQLTQAPWSLELIGVARHACRRNGNVPFVTQSPADAKMFATDERLQRVGWIMRGATDHARDAQRHALLYLIKQGWTEEELTLSVKK